MGSSIAIDTPVLADGAHMWRMAAACGLDRNSPYKYLVFCRDFADTSAIARVDCQPAGFVTGYRRPVAETLFIWQIGVVDGFRGRGVALAMLNELCQRGPKRIEFLEATITPSNGRSRRLFEGFAERRKAKWEEKTLFPADLFPEPHEPEILIRVGPMAMGSKAT